MKLLIKYNVDVNVADNVRVGLNIAFSICKDALQFSLLSMIYLQIIIFQEGWTPLHVAIQSRNRDIAKILLGNGADKTIKNKVTLLDIPP